jgi:hypothetical protein
MALPGTIQDRNFNNFQDRGDGTTNRFVTDTVSQGKLDAILTALGGAGSANTTPAISNFTATLANTEYSFALPPNCKGFVLRSRKIARVNFGYASGVNALYFSIPLGGFYNDTNFYTAQTIYFSSSVASNVLEIITFV